MNRLKKYYTISSIIYRLILALAVPALLIGHLGSALAGHNTALKGEDYLLIMYLVFTVAVLSLYINIDITHSIGNKILFLMAVSLVAISIGLGIYGLVDQFFICKCFTGSDNLFSVLIFIFLIISATLLTGLIKERTAR